MNPTTTPPASAVCPNCGQPGNHRANPTATIIGGYYTCQPKPPASETETPETDKAEVEFLNRYYEVQQPGWPSGAAMCAGFDSARSLERSRNAALAERDAAIKEASRRDKKWMDGITEACRTAINFDPIGDQFSHTPTLEQFIEGLLKERDAALSLVEVLEGEGYDAIIERRSLSWICMFINENIRASFEVRANSFALAISLAYARVRNIPVKETP